MIRKFHISLISCFFIVFNITNALSQTLQDYLDSTSFYQEIQEYTAALKWAEKAEKLAKSEFGENSREYTDALTSLYMCYYYQGDFNKAIQWCSKQISISKNITQIEQSEYIDMIIILANFYYQNNNYSEAENYYNQAINLLRSQKELNYEKIASTITQLAFCYDNLGNYSEAGKYYLEAYDIRKTLYKDNHLKIAISANNLAAFYQSQGKLELADKFYEESLNIQRSLLPMDTNGLIFVLTNIASFYSDINKFDKAENLFNEALTLSRSFSHLDKNELAYTLNLIGLFYKKIARYDKAELLFNEGLAIRRKILNSDNIDLAISLNNLAGLYEEVGKLSEAIPLYEESLVILRKNFKQDNPDLATVINNIGDIYIENGNYSKAELLLKEALDMRERMLDSINPDIAASYNNLGYLYLTTGRLVEAERYFHKSLHIMRKFYSSDNPKLATAINNLAVFYNKLQRYRVSEPLFMEALDMRKRLYGNKHPDIAVSLFNLGGYYDALNNFEKANDYFNNALYMLREYYNSDNPLLAKAIHSLANFYFANGKFNQAEPLYKEALDIRRRLFKTHNFDIAKSINEYAFFNFSIGKNSEATSLFDEGAKININLIKDNFPYLSEKEKKQFWSKISDDFESINNFSCFTYKNDPSILCKMFDIQLYSKSLLFNSNKIIKDRIYRSRDSILISLYEKWKDLKAYLILLYKFTNTDLQQRGINIDSLEEVTNNIEKQITLKSEYFKQSYDEKKITWRAIQLLLKPDEVAVEAIRFRKKVGNKFTDTVFYAFLIISERNEDNPEIVILENGDKLEKEYYNDYRINIENQLDDTISFIRYWLPLFDILKNYKKVYFSADGIYHKLNPSTLMMPDGKYILDFQNIIYVNSTKDIILNYYKLQEESNIYNSAVLIGNPNFALAKDSLREISTIYLKDDTNSQRAGNYIKRGIILSKLPGTEKEIRDINKILLSKKWDVQLYTGDSAVKTVLKTINNPRVLHIATHGIFLENISKSNNSIFGFDDQKMVENPLLRTGLLFSGADHFIKEQNNSFTGYENGILTAYEAMDLNLNRTELVVLSACETGLGEIQNGEGVFGLRRAFQNAGARAVLMSLWKVNDIATQELMSRFYENWSSGMTKRNAFITAQQYLKDKYLAPYYWGAFIMVGE